MKAKIIYKSLLLKQLLKIAVFPFSIAMSLDIGVHHFSVWAPLHSNLWYFGTSFHIISALGW